MYICIGICVQMYHNVSIFQYDTRIACNLPVSLAILSLLSARWRIAPNELFEWNSHVCEVRKPRFGDGTGQFVENCVSWHLVLLAPQCALSWRPPGVSEHAYRHCHCPINFSFERCLEMFGDFSMQLDRLGILSVKDDHGAPWHPGRPWILGTRCLCVAQVRDCQGIRSSSPNV